MRFVDEWAGTYTIPGISSIDCIYFPCPRDNMRKVSMSASRLDLLMCFREKADTSQAARAIGFYPPESGRDSIADHLALILRIYSAIPNHYQ
jgi:hypothetical protein